MFKKIFLLVLVIVLAKPTYDAVSLFLAEREKIVVEEIQTPVNTAAILIEDKTLPATSQEPGNVTSVRELADAFSYYFNQLATQFTIHYKGSTADLEEMLDQATKTALERDTYIAGHLATREITYEYTKQAATIHVTQSYLTNPQQEQVVDAVIGQVVAGLDMEAMTDYEKVKFVNDYIVKNTAYSDQTQASPHSAYAVAYEGQGVCQGYALFAQKLLTTLGIESMYITGEVYTGGHAWNLVKVDGEWYHLDTTWNDPVPDRGTGIRYNYFLLSDQQLGKDHNWQSATYPRAKSTKYTALHHMQDTYLKDEYVYFSHTEDENKLYRFNQVTGKSERLGNVRALYIVGIGEWLYFSNYSNGAYLSKMKIDGSELEVLYKEEVKNLSIEDSAIYFVTNTGNKKINLQ